MSLESDLDTPLARAVRAAGSQSAFGRIIGKRQSVVHDWLRRGVELPAELVTTVVDAELGLIHHDLRPDLFGPDYKPVRSPRGTLAQLEATR
jgi:DNA-binding transcriptional regulator YdaS (Cro superfamily)